MDHPIYHFRLTDLRRAQDLNRGLSFPAISASGSNAAVIHYQPQESTVKGINTEDIYLCELFDFVVLEQFCYSRLHIYLQETGGLRTETN